MTLADAGEYFGFGVWTLRAEANRGNLTIYRIGKRDYTTPNDIKEMVAKCRVDQKGHVSTSFRRKDSGLSETDRASSALAAANEVALMLRNSSRNTSATSTSRNRRVRQ
jgi:hypothetical protein